MTTEQRKKFSELFKNNIQKITIILVSIVYITQGIFTLVKKDTTVIDILGNIFLSIIVGTVISSNLSSMGLKDGRNSELFQGSLKVYGETKEKSTPFFDKLQSWCNYKNAQELELEKKDIIQSAGLNWKAYKYGYYEEHKDKASEEQLLAIEKAKNCTIIKLNAQDLFSDLSSAKHGFFGGRKMGDKFGATEKDFKAKSNISDIFTRVGLAIVSGTYALLPLITGENFIEIFAGVIWNTIQILIWLALGSMKYMDAKSFMEDEYRKTHIIQKTEYLNEFIVTMKNNPGVIEEYDDTLEINAYIEEYFAKKEKIKQERLAENNEQKTILD